MSAFQRTQSFYLLFACLLFGLRVGAQQSKQVDQPNVVVIYTDDHRYTGVHALGKQPVKTPHMDALADDGVVFTNAFLMGSFSGATCVPSRAMLLSGRQLFDLKRQGHTIPEEHRTMGETFQEAGYYTHIVGKWHQDNPSLHRSFHSGSTIMGRGVYLVDHFRMPLWDWDDSGAYKKEAAFLMTYNDEGTVERRPLTQKDKRGPIGTAADGPHTSEIFADNAISFIQTYRKPTPFFMYLAFHAPHDPRQAPEKYKAMYPPKDIQLTPSYMPQHPFDNGHLFLRDEELAPWPRTPEIARQELSDYYAIITHLDAQIGRVIASLKANGQYENTLIVFAGDSGLGVGNHGLLGKQNIYDEDGVHIPLILAGGAVTQKGKRIDAFTYTHDIFPTVCDWVNIPIPASVSGQSMTPLIRGEQKQGRNYTYHAYKQFQRAYRKGDFKLIEYVRAKDFNKKIGEFEAGSRVTQLFNIRQDPWETQDLSFFPQYQSTIQAMRFELQQKAIELGDRKERTGEVYDFWDFY